MLLVNSFKLDEDMIMLFESLIFLSVEAMLQSSTSKEGGTSKTSLLSLALLFCSRMDSKYMKVRVSLFKLVDLL